MRWPSKYERYFNSYRTYCKDNNIPLPKWVKLEMFYYRMVSALPESLHVQVSSTNIYKGTWEYLVWLKHVELENDEHVPPDLYELSLYTQDILSRMYDAVIEDRYRNFCEKNRYTVTRFGRKIMIPYIEEAFYHNLKYIGDLKPLEFPDFLPEPRYWDVYRGKCIL